MSEEVEAARSKWKAAEGPHDRVEARKLLHTAREHQRTAQEDWQKASRLLRQLTRLIKDESEKDLMDSEISRLTRTLTKAKDALYPRV